VGERGREGVKVDYARSREEITGGVRWYVVPERLLVDESQWQELMDLGAEELELKLTAEQYARVRRRHLVGRGGG
jgi:hypothetical protein